LVGDIRDEHDEPATIVTPGAVQRARAT